MHQSHMKGQSGAEIVAIFLMLCYCTPLAAISLQFPLGVLSVGPENPILGTCKLSKCQ